MMQKRKEGSGFNVALNSLLFIHKLVFENFFTNCSFEVQDSPGKLSKIPKWLLYL